MTSIESLAAGLGLPCLIQRWVRQTPQPSYSV